MKSGLTMTLLMPTILIINRDQNLHLCAFSLRKETVPFKSKLFAFLELLMCKDVNAKV